MISAIEISFTNMRQQYHLVCAVLLLCLTSQVHAFRTSVQPFSSPRAVRIRSLAYHSTARLSLSSADTSISSQARSKFATFAAAVLLSASSLSVHPEPVWAFGPEQIALTMESYASVECPNALKAGRIGGALGASCCCSDAESHHC